MKQILINRQGRIIEWDGDEDVVSIHHEIAHKILPNETHPLDVLIKRGWIVVGSRFTQPYSKLRPNQSQIDTLFDLGVKYVYNLYNNEQLYPF